MLVLEASLGVRSLSCILPHWIEVEDAWMMDRMIYLDTDER
jgi:hypothetical protein